jgi:hypothetical protein
MSASALAAINPVHVPIVAAKRAPLKNAALLLGGRQEKAELPVECSGYYLRPHKPTDLTRCN